MVASNIGSVFSGILDLSANTRFSDVWMQLYEKETFEYNYGTAIQIAGNNVPVTIVLNSTFLNNFGDSGAAINLYQGGALYCKHCHFEMDEKYRQYDDNFIDSLKYMK